MLSESRSLWSAVVSLRGPCTVSSNSYPVGRLKQDSRALPTYRPRKTELRTFVRSRSAIVNPETKCARLRSTRTRRAREKEIEIGQ